MALVNPYARTLVNPYESAKDQENIKAEQDRILESASDPLGGLGGDENASPGAGISLGGAVTSDAYRAGIGRRFHQAIQGISQIFSSKEDSDRIAAQNAEDEAALARYHEANPDQKAAFGLGEATEAAAETITAARYIPSPKALRIAGPGKLKTAARIGYSGTVGAAVASTHPTSPGESKLEQAGKGAAFGAGAGAAVETVAAAVKPLARLFTTKAQSQESGGLVPENPAYERGVAIKEATGTQMTPGQITGSPNLSEMKVPSGFAEKQAKQALRYFSKLRDSFSASPKPSSEMATKFGEATDDIYDNLVKRRKFVGDFRYDQFRNSVTEIHADKFVRAIDDVAEDAVPGTASGKILPLRRQLTKQLEDSGGTLTPRQFQVWKERVDGLLTGRSDIFKDLSKANQRRIGAQLSDALYASVDDTAALLERQGANGPSALLRKATEDYRRYSAPIRELEQSALGAIFRAREPDGKSIKITPEAAARKLLSLEPSQIKGLYPILQRHDPSLIDMYQATRLHAAIKQSVATTPETAGRLASQTKFRPQAALKELTKKDGLRAAYEPDPERLRRVRIGVSLLDRISDRVVSASGGRQGIQSTAAELTADAISGSPTFIGRSAAKILGPIGLWKLTSTEGGIKTLRALATAPINSPKFLAAAEDLALNLEDMPQ